MKSGFIRIVGLGSYLGLSLAIVAIKLPILITPFQGHITFFTKSHDPSSSVATQTGLLRGMGTHSGCYKGISTSLSETGFWNFGGMLCIS